MQKWWLQGVHAKKPPAVIIHSNTPPIRPSNTLLMVNRRNGFLNITPIQGDGYKLCMARIVWIIKVHLNVESWAGRISGQGQHVSTYTRSIESLLDPEHGQNAIKHDLWPQRILQKWVGQSKKQNITATLKLLYTVYRYVVHSIKNKITSSFITLVKGIKSVCRLKHHLVQLLL